MKQSTVNARIKLLRTSLNLSQQEFGLLAKISSSLISKIESNVIEPSHDVIEKICDTWNVSPDYLINGKGELTFNKVKLPTESKSFDPARDTLYLELKDQIIYLRSIVTQLSGNKSFLHKVRPTG